MRFIKIMTSFFFLLVSLNTFAAPFSYGPIDTSKAIKLSGLYINFGAGKISSQGLMGEIGATFFTSSNWGGAISYCSLQRKKTVPSNINQIGCRGCSERIRNISARLLIKIPTRSNLNRISLEGGLTLGQNLLIRYNYSPSFQIISSRRARIIDSKPHIGLSFRAKAEFPFTRMWGMEFALVSNVNPQYTFAGFEINMTLGLLRG